MKNLTVIDQPKSLATIAYEHLHASIMAGELKRNEIYNEMALAGKLGISRTPVREALLKLSDKGLVTFLPRKGVVINQYSRQDIVEIFEIRRVVELYAVKKLADSSGTYDLTPLEAALAEQHEAIRNLDIIPYLRANGEFHRQLAALLGNKRLVAVFDNISDLLQLMSVQILSLDKPRMRQMAADHQLVLDGICKGESEKAVAGMARHIDSSEQAALNSLRRKQG